MPDFSAITALRLNKTTLVLDCQGLVCLQLLPGWGAPTMAALIIIVLIAGAGYLLSVRIHPLRPCRVCNASGRHFGTMYSYAHRRCRKCGGSGRQDRLGARLFFGGTGGTGIFKPKS